LKTSILQRVNYKNLLFFLGLVAIYLVWNFDSFINSFGAGLDPSWILGLNWANDMRVQWGGGGGGLKLNYFK
jgi:hypothetical protein